MKKFLVILFLLSEGLLSYKLEGGDTFLGAGLGANVNVVRYDKATKETPKADMPMLINFDYSLDGTVGFYGTFMPKFGPDAVTILLEGGSKYYFPLDAPYVPYVGAGLNFAVLFPTNKKANHYNIGLSPSMGLDFFATGNFLIGFSLKFNPSLAFIGNENTFEFGSMGLLDVSFKL